MNQQETIKRLEQILEYAKTPNAQKCEVVRLIEKLDNEIYED